MGSSLQEYYRNDDFIFEIEIIMGIMHQVAIALHYLAGLCIVHRNVNPLSVKFTGGTYELED